MDRFGAGVYTSSASNKYVVRYRRISESHMSIPLLARSYSYTRGGTGAIILTKVVLGKVRNVAAWNEVMNCPPGFDSVSA